MLDHHSEGGGDVGRLLSYPGVSPTEADSDVDSPAEAYILSKSDGPGQKGARWRLDTAARLMGHRDRLTCPWHTWRRPEMQALRRKLADKVTRDEYVPSTANVILQCVTGVLKECWRRYDGLRYTMDTDAYERTVDAAQPIKGDRRRREVRTLTSRELALCLAVCQADPFVAGRRDGLLLALASTVGLRAEEYSKLMLADIDTERGIVRVRDGKGGKDRDVPLVSGVLPYLDAWLAVRGLTPGVLFCRVTVNRREPLTVFTPLSPLSISKAIERRVLAAGLKRATSHATRRAAATRIINSSGSTAIAREVLGHDNDTLVTRLYYDPEQDVIHRAVEKMGVPFVPLVRAETPPPDPDAPPAPPVRDRLQAVLLAMQAAVGE